MNKHHDIGKIQFHGNFFEITIDGVTKRFQVKKISPLLEKASEIERNTKLRRPGMGYIGRYWMKTFPLMGCWELSAHLQEKEKSHNS